MDIDNVRGRVRRALGPIASATSATTAPKDFLFTAQPLDAGRDLPPYHHVYFVLFDLMGFRNLGQFEKIAWSAPIDFKGRAYLIEHRKFGLGIFGPAGAQADTDANEIVQRIGKAVRAAEPYLTWKASEAVKASRLNVVNHAPDLFKRFEYFANAYREKRDEAERRKDETIVTHLPNGGIIGEFPAWKLREEAKWLAISTIEAFFSWTEHVFILAAILQGKCIEGEAVAELSLRDWGVKFQAALDIKDKKTKRFYDDLVIIRQQLRNLVAHGAFGKQHEAFSFHSRAGAVPVRVVERGRGRAYRFGFGVDFVEDEAIELLHAFVVHFWSGERHPAWIYIQDWQLPVILTRAADGSYKTAMQTTEGMQAFVRHLAEEMDRSANMDW